MNTKFSVWKDTAQPSTFPSLTTHLEVDVAIIGGGITGITAAYLLSKAGKTVAVLEAWKIGQSSTGFSTGNLYAMVGNEGLHKIESKHDSETMKAVVESRKQAVGFIEQRIHEYQIDCDFRRVPWCLFTDNDKRLSFIEKEQDAAERCGLLLTKEVPFPVKSKGFSVPGQAQFNPLQYTVALASAIVSDKCLIFENTKVTKIGDGEPTTLTTTLGSVRAKNVIMATHTPKGFHPVQTVLGPYREYAVAVTLNGDYPAPGIYWDMQETQHVSMRTYNTSEGQVLLALGETHKVGQKEDNEECFLRLEGFLRNRFNVAEVKFRWAAQQYKPADGLPYIGRSHKGSNTFIATGFAADGLTFGTLSAMIISDEILGIKNPWSRYYDSGRITPIASAKDFLKENINVAAEYIKDYSAKMDAKSFEEVAKGEAKIMEVDNERHAVYRDDNGRLHVINAKCSHMKCIVHWNKSEKTWDCPCHGSRFNTDGEVLEGPAISALEKKNIV